MDKTLVIVESPAKAKTIGRFLGNTAKVLASMGHISDLPQHNLGIDVANNFMPTYELTVNGKKVIRNLTTAAKSVDKIYLATDPDREGEAIAWHLKNQLSAATKSPFYRISFHEITKSAIQNSFAAAGDIDIDMVNAQQARRVLDRLVGYQVSPMLWQSIQKNTSAGRVQTVALRLIVEREREIQNFKAEEYWNLDAIFQPRSCKSQIQMRLSKINGDKAVVSNQKQAESLAKALQDAKCSHAVSKVTSTPRQQHASPPFITSTLQQAAGSNLKFGTSLTMKIAQELYEGVEIGGHGETGLITYMRTDSVNISKEAQDAARKFITSHYGPEYVPAKPNIYKSRNTAQEAHEAIRPTDVTRTPESLTPYLTAQQLKLYRLIWIRFVASQMTSANQIDHAIEISSTGPTLKKLAWDKQSGIDSCTFRASYRETTFPGHLAVYNMSDIEELSEKESEKQLPKLSEGTVCQLINLLTEQCFTNPPFRYSEAALVKALEQNGVGRPSTYAATVKTICDRKYVEKEKGSLMPTKLGCDVCDFLVNKMPDLFDIGFTAKMESELDGIEEGKVDWVKMMEDFYGKFSNWMGKVGDQKDIAISQKQAEDILSIFGGKFKFDAPSTIGSRTYDDQKLVNSLNKQLTEGQKPLSVRQRGALLNLAAKYAVKLPAVAKSLNKLGLDDIIAAQNKANAAKTQQRETKQTTVVPDEMLDLLKVMKGISWEPPLKRGPKTYDDSKFYASINRCATRGDGLSQAQIDSIKRLAAKYSRQIANFDKYAEALNIIPVTEIRKSASEGNRKSAENSANSQQAQLLIELGGEIRNWHNAPTTGRRNFNDKSFYDSLARQFKLKGQLSDKQLSALAKLLAKYATEIPDYESKLQGVGVIAKPAPKTTGEMCPQCGAPLVLRSSRGKTFTACSAFPKCRFTK